MSLVGNALALPGTDTDACPGDGTVKKTPAQKTPPASPPGRAGQSDALPQPTAEAVAAPDDAKEHEVVTARPPPDRRLTPAPLATGRGRARPSATSSVPAALDASGVGLNWAFICDVAPVSRAVHFRTIVQLLGALSTLHTDVSKAPAERYYGAVCAANLMVRADGSVLLVRDPSALVSQPSALRAPELARSPTTADQQTDLFAVAVMLLEAILGRPVRPDEVIGLQTIEPHVHACFRQYAADPLLALARRGLAAAPSQRWVSARAFADAIVHVGGQRVASTADLQHLVQVTLARQAERLTPVHPTPEALSLPLPPASPALHTLMSTSREPSYAPVADRDAPQGRSSERPAVFDLDRASSAVSIEPDGLFTLATVPRPASRRSVRWLAAGVLLLGAIGWGVSAWLGSLAGEPVVAQTPPFESPAPATSAREAAPVEVRTPPAQTSTVGDDSRASRPALRPTTLASQVQADPKSAPPVSPVSPPPVSRARAAASPSVAQSGKPAERAAESPAVSSPRPLPRAPARVSSGYDPEGI